MSHLDPDARRLIARTKAVDDPSRADRARMRARLDASWAGLDRGAVGAPNARITHRLAFSTKLIVGGFSAVALLSLGAWQWTRLQPRAALRLETAPAPLVTAAAPPADAVGTTVVESGSATASSQVVAASEPAPRVRSRSARSRRIDNAPNVVSEPAPAPNVVSEPVSPPMAASAIEDSTRAPESAPMPSTIPDQALPSAPPSKRATYTLSELHAADRPVPAQARRNALQPIDDELALLGDAQDALQRGRPSQALQRVQEHAFRFPRGALARERLTVHTLALCALQRKAAARQVYAELARRAPDSPVLARVRLDCGF